MNENQPPLKKPSATSLLLREKAWEEFCAQPERMDALARQLIVLELTLPSLYLALLKLLLVKGQSLQLSYLLYSAFICWFVALLLTLLSLFPKFYQIDYGKPRATSTENENALSIEAFFTRSTRHKRLYILLAIFTFCAGTVSAFFDAIQ